MTEQVVRTLHNATKEECPSFLNHRPDPRTGEKPLNHIKHQLPPWLGPVLTLSHMKILQDLSILSSAEKSGKIHIKKKGEKDYG